MPATPVEVIWKGEVVGHIENPGVDNFHLYGTWVPAGGEIAEQFVAELTAAMGRWDEDMAGVSVLIGGQSPTPGEVTGLSGGEINVLVAPRPK
jgi:hypothetical protein